MRTSRVRLGPQLLAQTNPRPTSKRPNVLKAIGAGLIIVALIWVFQDRSGNVTKNPISLPESETVLGAEAAVSSDFYIYEIENSDTLFSISERFQVAWEELARVNGLKEPFALARGQKLKIPFSAATRQQRFYDNLKKKIYVVEQGDSFVGIAQKLNISVTDLLRANPDLTSPDFIRIGEVLQLP